MAQAKIHRQELPKEEGGAESMAKNVDNNIRQKLSRDTEFEMGRCVLLLRREEAAPEASHEEDLLLPGCLNHLLRELVVHAEGLFTQDVLPGIHHGQHCVLAEQKQG